MLSILSVCLSDHYPWCIGSSPQRDPPALVLLLYSYLLRRQDAPATVIWRPKLETCPNLFTWGHPLVGNVKVMFSQACVKISVHIGGCIPACTWGPPTGRYPSMHWGRHPQSGRHPPASRPPPHTRRPLQGTVRILLECFLVWNLFGTCLGLIWDFFGTLLGLYLTW